MTLKLNRWVYKSQKTNQIKVFSFIPWFLWCFRLSLGTSVLWLMLTGPVTWLCRFGRVDTRLSGKSPQAVHTVLQ